MRKERAFCGRSIWRKGIDNTVEKDLNICEIKDLDHPEISLYNDRAETKLVHYYEPEPGLFIAETPVVIERALLAGYEPVSVVGEEKIVKDQKALLSTLPDHIPIYVGTAQILSDIAGYRLARGLLCMMRRKKLPSPESVICGASRVVLLEEVQNPTNVGAIFRSAAALGIDAVLLTKGCSDPLYRRAARVSMGNVFNIPWTFLPKDIPVSDNTSSDKGRISYEPLMPAGRIEWLKSRGFYTAAMALSDDAVFLGSEDFSKYEKLAVIMGTESTGLHPDTIRSCDTSVMIPMKNGVDSLNVAAAAAVAFWELRRKEK